MNFYSSGGLGDALIVAAKILQTDANLKRSTWNHFEKRDMFFVQCTEIMRSIIPDVGCERVNDPEHEARYWSKEVKGGKYVNTSIAEMEYPWLNGKFGHVFSMAGQPIICIQTVAGRLNDMTRREISLEVVNQMQKRFPTAAIVLIGPERTQCDWPNVINVTGMTRSVIDTFHYINGCDLFIGQDGICSYYAAFTQKPTIINYHLPDLIHHYYNDKWGHVAPLMGINLVRNIPESGKCENVLEMVGRVK